MKADNKVYIDGKVVKERPIIFSSEMVRAYLAGRKTQTRRIVKGVALEWLQPGMFTPEYVAHPGNHLCPYGNPGDVLWWRETWIELIDEGLGHNVIAYKADGPNLKTNYEMNLKWRPSIFMPHWASRIQTPIMSVRVERLQDISEDDCWHEGIRLGSTVLGTLGYRDLYCDLWNKLNAKRGYSWESNPWVWVIEFEPTQNR